MLGHDCPFHDAEGMVRFLRGNIRRGKDNMFVAEGREGTGKSTTSQQICRRLDPRLDLEADSIMNPKHLLDVMEDGRKRQIYPLDEAINIFHNQDWATWQLKALTKIVRQMRIMESTWALAVPDFEGLHPYLRDYRVSQRFYHQPVFDQDGMGNGPPVPLWKSERFDYKEQRVVTRWVDLEFDLQIDCLDDDPQHRAYQKKKEDNFRELVQQMKARMGYEEEQERKKRRPRKNGAKPKLPPTTT